MKKILKIVAGALALVAVGCVGYGAYGYFDAVSDADDLGGRADALLAADLGGSSLGKERY